VYTPVVVVVYWWAAPLWHIDSKASENDLAILFANFIALFGAFVLRVELYPMDYMANC